MPDPDPDYRRGFRAGYRWAHANFYEGPGALFVAEREAREARTELICRGTLPDDPELLYAEGRQHGIVHAHREIFGAGDRSTRYEDWQQSRPRRGRRSR